MAGLLGDNFGGMYTDPGTLLAAGLLTGHGNLGANLAAGLLSAQQAARANREFDLQQSRATLQSQLMQAQVAEAQRQQRIQEAMDAAVKNNTIPGQPQMQPTDYEVPSGPAGPSSFNLGGYAQDIMGINPQAGIALQAQLAALRQHNLQKVGPGESLYDVTTNKTAFTAPAKPIMVDAGNAVIPTDPMTGKPVGAPIPKQVSPDAQYRRGTQFAVAGLDPNGSPSGDIEQVAQAIASGNMAPLSSFAMSHPRGQQIMARVYQINPNYDATEFNAKNKATSAFATGKQGDTVRFIGVALSHGQQLAQAAQALQNGNIPLFNQVANAFATQTGQPAPNNFDAVKNIYKNEVTKAILGGAGALGDRESVEKTIDNAKSPAQLLGVMQQYQGLLRGQLGGLKQQYEQTTGRNDFERFLSPAAKNLERGGMPTLEEINAEIARRQKQGG